MTKSIPLEIDIDLNREVLGLLRGTSCHSDIIIPLKKCLSRYEDVGSYCPDGKNYSYVCWHTNNIIFAYTTGMQKVSIRLAQTGDLDLNRLNSPDNFHKPNSWYSIPYNSSNLCILVNSAYESAKNS